jgi:hypothetical protein
MVHGAPRSETALRVSASVGVLVAKLGESCTAGLTALPRLRPRRHSREMDPLERTSPPLGPARTGHPGDR